MRDTAVCTTGLTKRFGATVAVRDLDLTIEHGEIFGFLGPNGAGKTTTMRMIAGLLRPTSGSVMVEGHDVVDEPLAVRRAIGFVPESPFLYDKLSGREFLQFVAGLFGVRNAGTSIERLLTLFDLQLQADDLIEGYSRGMRQKTGLAGALLHEPSV